MRRALVATTLGLLGLALWLRRHPSAMPYSVRIFVQLPHPGITRARLLEVLDPRPGERVLEVGPGTGYYALAVAERLTPGELEVCDVQQAMLDHVQREARKHGIANIAGRAADAQDMPFEPDRFDAAYVVQVLGEVPDQDAALRELARVVKPGGRVVVGELALDPHHVMPGALRGRAERAGLELERRAGGPLAYFARFQVPPSATA